MHARLKATWQKHATYTTLNQISSKGRRISGNRGCFPCPVSGLGSAVMQKIYTKTSATALITKLAFNPRAARETQPSAQRWRDAPGMLCLALGSRV